MSRFVNPFTDLGFKVIFGQPASKGLLITLLNELLAGEHHIEDLCFLDKEDLDAGKKITAETLVLWGANGLVEKFFNPLQCWLKFCINVQGRTLPCGHFIPEEAPIPLLAEVQRFL